MTTTHSPFSPDAVNDYAKVVVDWIIATAPKPMTPDQINAERAKVDMPPLPSEVWLPVMLILAFLLIPNLAHAAGAGGAMPWDQDLQRISQSFTGPFAYSMTILGLVAAAIGLWFAHHEGSAFIKACAFVVMVGSFLMGANAFANTMGWVGTVV